MTAEKYLEQIRMLDDMILTKLKEYNRWVAIAEGMGGFSVAERVQCTRNLQRGADAIGEYIDLEREINKLKRRKNEVIGTIQQLPFNEYKILYRIYNDGRMLKELPSEFDKSYEWVKKTKKKALRRLQGILDEKEKS